MRNTKLEHIYPLSSATLTSGIQEVYSVEENSDPRMLHAIDMGWFVLDKYYTITEDAPVYAASLLLHPSKRAKYINTKWPEAWRASAIGSARTIWEEEYKTAEMSESNDLAADVMLANHHAWNEFDFLADDMDVTDTPISIDDFDAFINTPPCKISVSPLEWWCQETKLRNYPRLSRMAIDLLSIPPQSADAEAAFSGGRRTFVLG
jgi:hypothetical protein